ncbi:MAG: hypothetical protein JRJ73_14595 [Deltaproteobacteria bacterium]|nr:hypothetical protein [Deltaproteobacteria bacterium]
MNTDIRDHMERLICAGISRQELTNPCFWCPFTPDECPPHCGTELMRQCLYELYEEIIEGG